MSPNTRYAKIVADSSADLFATPAGDFASAPLKIVTAEKEYVDDEHLDVARMVEELAHYKGKSSSSCPNPEDWLRCFGDAEEVYCVTITATLSGSYNAACVAKQMYEEQHPERKVFVINTLTAGPEMKLIVEKIRERLDAGKSFEEISEEIVAYSRNTGLLFMLESMKNLANNGRVSHLVAKAAGLLGIRVVGKASDRGDLEPLDKCRGEKKALETIVERMKSLGHRGSKVRIAHCFNTEAAEGLQQRILAAFPGSQVEIYPCRGLCSFYAEKGGLLVGFEKF